MEEVQFCLIKMVLRDLCTRMNVENLHVTIFQLSHWWGYKSPERKVRGTHLMNIVILKMKILKYFVAREWSYFD